MLKTVLHPENSILRGYNNKMWYFNSANKCSTYIPKFGIEELIMAGRIDFFMSNFL